MARKLNSMPDYQARMQKQPHDVSQATSFTSSTGMLLPIYFDMLHTGDELHFDGNITARLNPLINNATAKLDIHLDYFFVPLSVMYTPAPSMFYQTDDLISNQFTSSDASWEKFPVLDLDVVLQRIKSDSQAGVNDSQFYAGERFYQGAFDCRGKAAVRLCDLLEYDFYGLFEQFDTSTTHYNPVHTPWFLLAYHACYELYNGYRNSDREPKTYLYNIDSYYNAANIEPKDELMALHYVSSYKDYFTSLKVSPVGSSVSMLSRENSWDMLSKVNSYLYNDGDYSRVDVDGQQQSDDRYSTTSAFLTGNADYSFNAANIRQIFMVDKLLRVTGRANKDYESQFLAHFGIKIPHDVLHNITHIGHDMFTLTPEPVISTADTFNGESGSSLGQVGGQGYGNFHGKNRNFIAPCHGVFMVLYHCQPRFRYYPGISKLHDLSDPMKFWQPEYDRKGMQPVFSYEMLKGGRDTRPLNVNSYRMGWQFAFEQLKRKYDRCSLAFRNTERTDVVNNYSAWVLSRSPFKLPYSGISQDGSSQLDDNVTDNYTSFLSTPHDLDTIMQLRYQSQWISMLGYDEAHLLFATDPLIHDFCLNCKKVNFMSEYGEPELD